MPSARLCRKAAAHTQPCCWITDDVLADAFNRYARVSRASRRGSLCPRRHGSNVPGPLESHRRSAKRRLAYATAAPEYNTSFSFSALFGFSTHEQNINLPLDKRWQWQPPGLPAHGNAAALPNAQGVANQSQPDIWTHLSKAAHDLEVESRHDTVQNEHRAFEQAILDLPSDGRVVDFEILAPLVRLLGESELHLRAELLVCLVAAVSKLKLTDAALALVVETLTNKDLVAVLGKDHICSVVCSLLLMGKAESSRAALSAYSAFHTENVMEDVSLHLIKTLLPMQGFANSDSFVELKGTAETVLRYLRDCPELQGWHHSHPVWQKVYDALAIRFVDPADLADHLSEVANPDLARVLLRHWVPHVITRARAGEEQDLEPTDVSSARHIDLRAQTKRRPLARNMMRHLEMAIASRYNSSSHSSRPRSTLVTLLKILHYHRIPRQNLIKSIFAILRKRNKPATEMALLNEIRNCKTGSRILNLGISHSLALDMIDHFMATGYPRYARRVFYAIPSLPLSKCTELILQIIQEGKVESSNIVEMLWRQPSADMIPTAERSIPEMNLVPAHIELVHRAADAFAHSPHIRSRVAFRRVYECYRFLRDRRAPIDPLLSRALVRAGIIRPLQEMRHVSTMKCRWILSIVSVIEGQGTAALLDRLVYKLWWEKVLPAVRLHQFQNGIRQHLRIPPDPTPLAHAIRYRIRTWARSKRAYRTRRPAGTPRLKAYSGMSRLERRRAKRRALLSPSTNEADSLRKTEGSQVGSESSSLEL